MPLLIWEVDRLLLDQLVHFGIILRASVEGRETNDHLVCQNSESPPIDREGVTTFNQNLGRQVIGRATEGVGLGVSFEHLSEAEVSQADVAILVHQNVLRLQVTVDDVLLVQVTQGHSDLDCVESGPLFVEPRDLPQVHEKLATTDKSHDEENLLLRLEHIAHAHQEGVVSLEQDVLLEPGRLNLVELNNHILSQ